MFNQQLRTRAKDDVLTMFEDVVPPEREWGVQVFRSVDQYSALSVPDCERDVALAYIYQIRRAQKFIYIENQYFMGSSEWWPAFEEGKDNVKCKHRIPYELAMRVVRHVRPARTRAAPGACVACPSHACPRACGVRGLCLFFCLFFLEKFRFSDLGPLRSFSRNPGHFLLPGSAAHIFLL